MQTALKVRALSTAYREKLVLSQVSFDIPAGEVVGIIGPNGAGKSTLLKAILGLLPVLHGSVEIFGQDLKNVRSRIGYMPQQNDVDWDFPATVTDVVKMGLYGRLGWFKRVSRKDMEIVHEVMRVVGISDLAKRPIGQLSGGQKQRTFLARTLVGNPDLFFMDEPFAGVDVASEQAIVDVLVNLQKQGKTVVVVHHDLATVSRFCSYVLLINKEIVAFGPRQEVFKAETIRKAYGLPQIDTEISSAWAL